MLSSQSQSQGLKPSRSASCGCRSVQEKAAQAIEAIQGAFSEIEDPRREHGRLYPLAEVLFLGVVGILCGGDGWVGVAQVCSWNEP